MVGGGRIYAHFALAWYRTYCLNFKTWPPPPVNYAVIKGRFATLRRFWFVISHQLGGGRFVIRRRFCGDCFLILRRFRFVIIRRLRGGRFVTFRRLRCAILLRFLRASLNFPATWGIGVRLRVACQNSVGLRIEIGARLRIARRKIGAILRISRREIGVKLRIGLYYG